MKSSSRCRWVLTKYIKYNKRIGKSAKKIENKTVFFFEFPASTTKTYSVAEMTIPIGTQNAAHFEKCNQRNSF